MNRESYINALATELRPYFHSKGAMFPERIRYTCGWPSKGAGSRRKTVGQCFDASASADNHVEIIIGMSLDNEMEVAHTLAHELVHACVGVEAGHGPAFRKVALAVGLEGKMTDTTAGELFKRYAQPILDRLGPYPHKKLNYSNIKKQNTRMIKATCGECGYAVRLTRKWLDVGGAPICPVDHVQMKTS